MSEYQTTAQSRDVYQRVTDAIVNAIEQGAGAYRMPWVVRQDKGFSPISVSTVKPYRGVNTLVLWAQSQSKGYSSALWGTYQQWRSLGGQVRKGEHGSPVVYWGTYESKDTADFHHDSWASGPLRQRRITTNATAVTSSAKATPCSTWIRLTALSCPSGSSPS